MPVSLINNFSFLEMALLSTLIYFDQFDYPLTSIELKKWIYWPGFLSSGTPLDLLDIETTLQKSAQLSSVIETSSGFWFLRGRSDLIFTRGKRYREAQKKYRRLRRVLFWTRAVPFIRAVFVTNTLSYNNTRKESDIDLFMITAKDKMWSARFFMVSFLKLCGIRPRRDGYHQDAVCANFWVAESHLGVAEVAWRNRRGEIVDVHLAHLFGCMVPVWDDKNMLKKFFAENHWIDTFFGNDYHNRLNSTRRIRHTVLTRFCQSLLEKIFFEKGFERKVRQFQMKVLPVSLQKAALEHDTRVVVSDTILKFHLNDRRCDVLHEFSRRLNEYEEQLCQEQ